MPTLPDIQSTDALADLPVVVITPDNEAGTPMSLLLAIRLLNQRLKEGRSSFALEIVSTGERLIGERAVVQFLTGLTGEVK